MVGRARNSELTSSEYIYGKPACSFKLLDLFHLVYNNHELHLVLPNRLYSNLISNVNFSILTFHFKLVILNLYVTTVSKPRNGAFTPFPYLLRGYLSVLSRT